MSNTPSRGHIPGPAGDGQRLGSPEEPPRANDIGILETTDQVGAIANATTNDAAKSYVVRPRVVSVLAAAALATVLYVQLPGPAAAASGAPAEHLRVGHTVEQLSIPASVQTGCTQRSEDGPCMRVVDVHLWYPAAENGFSEWPKSVYQSQLYGRSLDPTSWQPLSWQVEAEVAREGAPIDRHGPAFPVIVFSHGSTNDPIDYAHTLELIAGHGFVVAAPYHVNNTQDDARIDYINGEFKRLGLPTWDCNDHISPPCSRTNVPASMKDRANDISRILDRLDKGKREHWRLGDRVDLSRVGVMGHSRGTVTALTAAGGSLPNVWDIKAEPRVKAIMGMAIGAEAITFGANLAEVAVPALLVAGGRDQNPSQPRPALAVSKAAFDTIRSEDKAFVTIPNATHRSFDSTYCAQMQAAAAVADKEPFGNGNGRIEDSEVAKWKADAPLNPRKMSAPLDWDTVRLISSSFPGGLSGKAVHYCSPDYFTSPVWIAPAVVQFNPLAEVAEPLPDLSSPPSAVSSPSCPATTPTVVPVPCTGLDTEEVKQGVTELATTFFGTVLKGGGADGMHFTRYLAPKWLEKHVPMAGAGEAVAGGHAVCPPGQGVTCNG